jgi:ribose/xylose/arabinose/galactoside ABC-type transport system permease subunit
MTSIAARTAAEISQRGRIRSAAFQGFFEGSIKATLIALTLLSVLTTVVIIAGGIDLSAGSMIALSGTICATTMLALAPALPALPAASVYAAEALETMPVTVLPAVGVKVAVAT